MTFLKLVAVSDNQTIQALPEGFDRAEGERLRTRRDPQRCPVLRHGAAE
ncbi:MAG: hypothetical protein PGN25_04125 [Methylorubrum populi]